VEAVPGSGHKTRSNYRGTVTSKKKTKRVTDADVSGMESLFPSASVLMREAVTGFFNFSSGGKTNGIQSSGRPTGQIAKRRCIAIKL
jgi:hypothetical protein